MRRGLAIAITGGTWFFTVTSWLALVVLLCLSLPAPPGGFEADVFRVGRADGPDLTAWGLSYRGQVGSAVLVSQIILLAVLAVAACRREPVLRRIGLLGIALWATLWAVGFTRLTAATGLAAGATILVCAECLCTIAEMVRRWNGHLPAPSAR